MLKNVKFIKSCPNSSNWIEDDKKEIVILGKSNVGKSTFINRLCNNSTMAKVSSTPGRTRLLNFFDVDNRYRLVDAPGYGYAAVNKYHDEEFAKMMDEYFSKRNNLVGAIFLLDSRREISEDDISLFNMLLDHNLPFILVATKCDKLNQSEEYRVNKNIIEGLSLLADSKIIHSSLKKDKWINEVIERIEYIIK